jgi:hypothetical protein
LLEATASIRTSRPEPRPDTPTKQVVGAERGVEQPRDVGCSGVVREQHFQEHQIIDVLADGRERTVEIQQGTLGLRYAAGGKLTRTRRILRDEREIAHRRANRKCRMLRHQPSRRRCSGGAL